MNALSNQTTHFSMVKKMAADRGLEEIVALADKGINLCRQITRQTTVYSGSRTAKEYASAQAACDNRKSNIEAEIGTIMAALNADQSWLTAKCL